jgi:AmiR/NasT family two-component response regulator
MNCSGEQAYQAMRQKAMQKRCTLGEIARTILKQQKAG